MALHNYKAQGSLGEYLAATDAEVLAAIGGDGRSFAVGPLRGPCLSPGSPTPEKQ